MRDKEEMYSQYEVTTLIKLTIQKFAPDASYAVKESFINSILKNKTKPQRESHNHNQEAWDDMIEGGLIDKEQ